MNELSRYAWEQAIWSLCRRFGGDERGWHFQRPALSGELSSDSRGSALPGASGRGNGKVFPVTPSESPRHFAALGMKVS